MILINEEEFSKRIFKILEIHRNELSFAGSVTGPGRSGAIAAVYASHILKIPYIPFGSKIPTHLGRLLIIDTASQTGKTLRKAERKYRYADPIVITCYREPPRVYFWYESRNLRRYRHNGFNQRSTQPSTNKPYELS